MLVDLADEAEPALVQRADEPLVVAGVADRLAGGGDAAAERRLGHDPALPDGIDQLLPAHRPLAVANEVDEHVKYLRLDVNYLAGAPQFLPRNIDLEIGEAETQPFSPACFVRWLCPVSRLRVRRQSPGRVQY